MKTIKKFIYSIVIAVFCAVVAINLFFNVIVDDLRQYTKLHLDRNSLYDSAIICTQLYFMNPNRVNQLTCEKITNKIEFINNELGQYYFANLYLGAIK